MSLNWCGKDRNLKSQLLQTDGERMTLLHVGAAILLTSLYTFTTIFISIFPWLGENAIGNPPFSTQSHYQPLASSSPMSTKGFATCLNLMITGWAVGGYVATACYMSYLVLFGTCYLRAWLTEPGSPSAAWKVHDTRPSR